jgi:hypothetical protein
MSLVNSIIAGDRLPMGSRGRRAIDTFAISGTAVRSRFHDRDQDVIQIWMEGSSENFVRAQVLFDNPTQTARVQRPIGDCALQLTNLFDVSNFPYRRAEGYVDVIEIRDFDGGRLLLDPYLAKINDEIF